MNVTDIKRQFNPNWITTAVDEECINLCEQLAKEMADAKISSSFLRNIFGELRRIEAGGFEKNRTAFVLLRPKLAYACGRAADREKKLRPLYDNFQEFYKLAAAQVTDERSFKSLVSTMEAIIAFHKANGGSSK